MVSMERIHHYSRTAGEGDSAEQTREDDPAERRPGDEDSEESRGDGSSDETDRLEGPAPLPVPALPTGWPEHGRVTFVDVSLRYR